MKKLIITIIISWLICFLANAQHIPDKKFADAIRKECKECIDAKNNLLSPAKKLKSLSPPIDDSIRSVAGIEGFSSLEKLDIRENNISILPSLPESLAELNCSHNKLSALPRLPRGLTLLDCSSNDIIILPPLPVTLKLLIIYYTKIKSLPSLPPQLQELNCAATPIARLPLLPASLTDLVCNETDIAILPELPGGLKELSVYDTKISSLPALPEHLKKLEINSSVIDCIRCKNAHLEITDADLNTVKAKKIFYCPGYPAADVAKTETKIEESETKILPKVYFFIPGKFRGGFANKTEDAGDDHYSSDDEAGEPVNDVHLVTGGLMAVIYLGSDEKPDPAMRDIRTTYKFEVSYYPYLATSESVWDSYEVKTYPRQRSVWKFIPFADFDGPKTYTVRVYAKDYSSKPIAEGKVTLH